jgi:hypothetical protein
MRIWRERVALLFLLGLASASAQVVILNPVSGGAETPDAPLFSLLGDEGTGNPDYTGSDGSGTCDFANLGWATTPTAMEGNGTTTNGNCGTGLDAAVTENVTFTGCHSPDTFGENAAGRVWAKQNDDNSGLSWHILLNDADDTLTVQVFDTGGGQRGGTTPITVGTGWEHFAVSFSNCGSPITSCAIQIYLDGSAVTTTATGTGTSNRISDGTSGLRFINRGVSDRTYDGKMNRLAAYPLQTAGQVAAIAAAADCGN